MNKKYFLSLSFALFSLLPNAFLAGNEGVKEIRGANQIRFDKDEIYPSFLKFKPGSEISFEDAAGWIKINFAFSAEEELKVYSTESDRLGFIHYRCSQTYKGFTVEDAMYIIHTKTTK